MTTMMTEETKEETDKDIFAFKSYFIKKKHYEILLAPRRLFASSRSRFKEATSADTSLVRDKFILLFVFMLLALLFPCVGEVETRRAKGRVGDTDDNI